MLSKLIPLVFLILGTGAGVGAGIFLAPAAPSENHDTATAEAKSEAAHADHEEAATTEFVKLNNQFVVPVVKSGQVSSLVVMSLSVETSVSMNDTVFEREPKLRDLFLRVLFDHANMGGFDGAFTQPERLDVLRLALRDVAVKELGENVAGILITDIARQDN
ncbi:flagellar basal body-associated protein FliL [Sedimentitalea sp. HM32M-2]|uniref:flagellar basal body-associated protein FliL n=1 Tax=Sedimentitalea sp. HM32M-2 TaxID=3351566 RepID=UPI0036427B61